MADTAEGRVFSEDEMTAIIADRVQRETATLSDENASLQNKLDVEIAAREAAEQRATTAEQSLADFKAEIAAREEAAKRKDERITKIRESASHLPEEFFTDEARITRIVAMDEDTFSGYLSDLAAASVQAPSTNDPTQPPRESAMRGEPVKPNTDPGAAAKAFFFRGLTSAAKEG